MPLRTIGKPSFAAVLSVRWGAEAAARMTAADRTSEFVNSDCALAQKGLAFPSKESVYVDVRGVKNDRRTPFAPSIASIRGSSW